MLDPQSREQVEKGFQTVKVTWMAMLGIQAAMLVGAHFIPMPLLEGKGMDTATRERLITILAGVGAFELVLAHVLKRFLVSRPQLIRPGAGPKAGSPVHPAVGKYLLALLIPWALMTGVGIYGLILFMIEAKDTVLYGFFGATLVATGLMPPKPEEMVALAERLDQKSGQG